MLDENLPTYRFRASSDNPLNTLLYFTHNGSEPSADYLIKRPPPSSSHNQYALGLFDIQYASVLYAEVLVRPEWSQPTLSAAEVRANGGSPVAVPVTPSAFSVSLYNPDHTVKVRHQQGSWSKDSWEFEVPARSFRMPSTSKIDQDAVEPQASELIPKVNFRWKRDGRMSKDMTCYMSGKTVGGKKSKEPDITVALFKAGRNDGAISMYEPNMARVDIEDRKGLEVVLLLSAEVIKDLYVSPRHDLFNTTGAPQPTTTDANSGASRPLPPPSGRSGTSPGAATSGPAMSGALANAEASSQRPPSGSSPRPDLQMRADVDAETKRRRAMIGDQSARDKRVQREQEEIKKMLEREERQEAGRKRREKKEREKQVNRETEELRKKYGPQPELPPRPANDDGRGGRAGWFGRAAGSSPPPQPPRPQSVGPSPGPSSGGVRFAQRQPPSQQSGASSGGTRTKLGNLLHVSSPYTGPAGPS